MSMASTGHVAHVETASRAKEMIDALLRQFEDVVFYLREAELPVDMLANSNLGAAYEEIKMLDSRISHLHQSMLLASSASSTPITASPLLIDTPHHGSSFSTSTSSVSAHPIMYVHSFSLKSAPRFLACAARLQALSAFSFFFFFF